MAIADIYRAEVHYNIGSERTMNVVHLKEIVTCTDPLPSATVAEVVYEFWSDNYQTLLFSSDSDVVLIHVQRIKPTAGVPSTIVVGSAEFPSLVPLGAVKPIPSQAAALISFYTDQHDRSGRGRIYLPGLAPGTTNDGQLLAAPFLALQGFADDFKVDQPAIAPGTGEWHFAVYSRSLAAAELITGVVAHTNLATQRGRRNFPGLGV